MSVKILLSDRTNVNKHRKVGVEDCIFRQLSFEQDMVRTILNVTHLPNVRSELQSRHFDRRIPRYLTRLENIDSTNENDLSAATKILCTVMDIYSMISMDPQVDMIAGRWLGW